MAQERLTILLLPGMDGTGDLFVELVRLLPDWIEPRVVNYPRNQELSYDQLLPILKSSLPSDKSFVILAESFSTPLAIKFAAERPNGLRALVICAGFVLPPRRDILARVTLALAPVIFSLGLPKSICRRFLVGETASIAVVDKVRATVARVSSGVLAHRLRSVLSCDCEREVKDIAVPLLYISGRDDRLVRSSSFKEIQRTKPDALLAIIEAPHLLLQVKPHEAVDVVVPFLRTIRAEDPE